MIIDDNYFIYFLDDLTVWLFQSHFQLLNFFYQFINLLLLFFYDLLLLLHRFYQWHHKLGVRKTVCFFFAFWDDDPIKFIPWFQGCLFYFLGNETVVPDFF